MRRLSDVLKETYGEKVYKLSLTSGCTCPNRDGSLKLRAGEAGRDSHESGFVPMYGGCTFCSEGGSGEFAASPAPLEEQIREAKARIAAKTDARKFIAYFQSFTNTYGDPARLKKLYMDAISRREVEILSLGTRPDCIPGPILEMLRELNSVKPVWVELGLQTIHEKTAERIRRGYRLPVFEETYRRLKAAGLTVIVHVIFGLPGETAEEMLETVRYLARLYEETHPASACDAENAGDPGRDADGAGDPDREADASGWPVRAPDADGIKLQMLQILRGTKIAEEYEREPFPLLSLEEYTELVRQSVALMPADAVLHRMTGDGPKKLLIAPLWCADKKRVLNTMNRALRDQFQ